MEYGSNIPLVLQNMQKFAYLDECIEAEEDELNSNYNKDLQVMVGRDNLPLWMTRTKKIPTSTHTPGKTLPSGYTRSGKWKPSKYVPSKMDKRAGK